MTDLTVVFYTANVIAPRFGEAVVERLRQSVPRGVPMVAVSHSRGGIVPALEYHFEAEAGMMRTLFAYDAPRAIAQVYRNILMACEAAETRFVVFCEDDSLYVPEHFTYRPHEDTFAYNENRVVLTRQLATDGRAREAFYYYRPRTQMAMGLCARELMIETLREKFAKYPDPPLDTTVAKKAGWGEPGRYERNLGLTRRRIDRLAWTPRPNVTFNHTESLMGRRRVNPDDVIYQSVKPWGNATELWESVHG